MKRYISNRVNSSSKSETIDNLVNEAVRLYMREDYDYVESLARRGEKPESAYNNTEEEIKFLENAGIFTDTPYDIKLEVVKQYLARINQIDEDLWNKYNS